MDFAWTGIELPGNGVEVVLAQPDHELWLVFDDAALSAEGLSWHSIWDEAENRLHAQKALMVWLLERAG